ncbi:MAG: RNase adapter RapZ [bacterium]
MSALASFDHISSLIIVTGLSGAGKSSAMDLLADSGYYIVDNLPVPLLNNFLAFSKTAGARFSHTALLLDIDSQESRAQLMPLLLSTTPRAANLKIIFLDAETRAIVRRYSETRRPHPGFDPIKDKTLEDTIQRERARLQPIKEAANLVLDTSSLTIHDLKRELRSFLASLGTAQGRSMLVNFLSFGFKHGSPIDCDLLIDVRFLKNPYFIEELREQDGRDAGVRDYVFSSPDATEFVNKYAELLAFLLPRYQFEGKAYLNIGVGCTGGKHRSVAIAEALSKKIDSTHYLTSVKHRDLTNDPD